jgi:putative addiction module component (TIGR02574 family)
MTLNELETEALRLDPKSRALLAERLLGSLDALSEAEIEKLWLDEAERREQEWDAGKVEGIPADQVLRELRSSPK